LAFPRHIDGVKLEAADEGYILHQADLDLVHYLNPPAVLVWELCDGRRSGEEIAELVTRAYASGAGAMIAVPDTLARLSEAGLIEYLS